MLEPQSVPTHPIPTDKAFVILGIFGVIFLVFLVIFKILGILEIMPGCTPGP